MVSAHRVDSCRVATQGHFLLLVALGLWISGCHSLSPSPFWPSLSAAGFSGVEIGDSDEGESAKSPEWSAAPLVIERALRAPLEVLSAEDVEHGQTLTKRFTVFSRTEGLEFEIKWKAAKPSLDGVNNAPRREIAAYLVQRLVLDPQDYVVPTTDLLCLALHAAPGMTVGSANVEGARCVVGAASLWLHNVRYPVKKIDWQRFAAEPGYAHHAANLNLVAILMDHSDTHSRNLLVSDAARPRRMYSVDNGISFNSWFRSPFSRDWNRLRVPALRRESIDRLRALRREDLAYLSVLAELRKNPSGIYEPVPPGAVIDPQRGVRIRDGVIQLGLTEREIDGVWRRIGRVLQRVDKGKLALF